MTLAFRPGYGEAPYAALVSDCPGKAGSPIKSFRLEWGPIFHRGRLDGTARLRVLGQDPAQHEAILRRTPVGTARKRVQGFLARLGLTRSHTMVVAFGGLAGQAWTQWLGSERNEGRPVLPYRHGPHPTTPEAVGKTPERAAITCALAKYDEALAELRAAVRPPDRRVPFKPYGKSFRSEDLPDIPAFDLPPGTPDGTRRLGKRADRVGHGQVKRRTIVVTAPPDAVR